MSTISSTFKHALIYSGAGILGKAVGFIMLPVYAHYLRGEGYGIIGMIDVVLSVLTMLIGYGIQGAMERLYYEEEKIQDRDAIVSTAIYVMLFFVLSVSLPVILFSRPVAYLSFGDSEKSFYITLAVITFIADLSSKNAETYIIIRQQSIFYSALSICRLGLGLSLNIYMIVYKEMGVLGYLYSGLITAIVFSIATHFWALFNVGFHFNKKHAFAILKFSIPLLPGYIAMFFRGNADRVILRATLGLSKLGTYEMLFKFATLIGFLIVEPFNKIWTVKRFEIAETSDGPEIMAKVFNMQFAILLFIGLILSLEIPLILRVMTPEEFWIGGTVAFLAVMSRVILGCYYHFFFGILYAKKTHKLSIIQITSAITSIVANILLIIPFGITGAVAASCISNVFQCVLAYRMSQPFYRIPYEWQRVAIMAGMAVLIFFFADWMSISRLPGMSENIDIIVRPQLTAFLVWLKADLIRNGKLIEYIVNNVPIIFDAILKLIISCSYLIGLVMVGILPRQKLIAIIKRRPLPAAPNI